MLRREVRYKYESYTVVRSGNMGCDGNMFLGCGQVNCDSTIMSFMTGLRLLERRPGRNVNTCEYICSCENY